MRTFVFFLIFISICLVIYAFESSKEETQFLSKDVSKPNLNFDKDENIYVLTDENFELFIKLNPTSFVKFYAPW